MNTRTITVLLFATAALYGCTAESSAPTTNHTEVTALTTDPVVLINTFVVPEGSDEAAIRFWEQARDFLKEQPGYISTQLHQSLQPDATFLLVNVAVWESPEAFQTASQRMSHEIDLPRIEGL